LFESEISQPTFSSVIRTETFHGKNLKNKLRQNYNFLKGIPQQDTIIFWEKIIGDKVTGDKKKGKGD